MNMREMVRASGKRSAWLALMLIWPCLTFASDDSERIRGVADFLVERANDNYLYIFEKAIRSNEAFQCYFPETLSNLEVGGLKELLYSRGLWQASIDTDLEILATRAIASNLEKNLALSERAVTLAGDLVEVMAVLELEYAGARYPLNVLPVNADGVLRSRINGFYSLEKLVNAMNEFRRYRGTDLCSMPTQDFDAFKTSVDALVRLPDVMKDFVEHAVLYSGDLALAVPAADACRAMGMDAGCTPDVTTWFVETVDRRLDEALDEMASATVAQRVSTIAELARSYEEKNSSKTEKVVAALKVIRGSETLAKGRFEELSRHIMFFAQVCDSETPGEVEALLKAYTLPSVSFYKKREYGAHWMLTSYLGAAAGDSLGDDLTQEPDNNAGIYAPIGFEMTYGTGKRGSLSLMVSPVDFGYPVSLKFNGIEEDVTFDEIFAPSISLAYGFREYPVVLGIAYQRGRRIATGDAEERVLLFAAFDMPLWSFGR